MAFIDLFACLLTGLAMGGLFYFIVTTGLLQLIGQVDMFTPAAVSVLLFAVALGWKFDYSLTVFFDELYRRNKRPRKCHIINNRQVEVCHFSYWLCIGLVSKPDWLRSKLAASVINYFLFYAIISYCTALG